MKPAILVVLAVLCQIAYGQNPLCPIQPNYATVPEGWRRQPDAFHTDISGKLQIFENHRITCDGQLTGWEYKTDQQVFPEVFFAVFRIIGEEGGHPVFKIVGSTYIKSEPANWLPGAWTTAQVKPIDVVVGDHVGFFYRDRNAPGNLLMVPHGPNPNSRVFNYDLDASNIQDRTVKGEPVITMMEPAFSARVSRPPPAPGAPPAASMPLAAPMTTQAPRPTMPPTRPPQRPPQRQDGHLDAQRGQGSSERCDMASPDSLMPDVNCAWPAWRAYFDKTSGSCVAYFGCGQDSGQAANNFDSLQSCRLACPSREPEQQGSMNRFYPQQFQARLQAPQYNQPPNVQQFGNPLPGGGQAGSPNYWNFLRQVPGWENNGQEEGEGEGGNSQMPLNNYFSPGQWGQLGDMQGNMMPNMQGNSMMPDVQGNLPTQMPGLQGNNMPGLQSGNMPGNLQGGNIPGLQSGNLGNIDFTQGQFGPVNWQQNNNTANPMNLNAQPMQFRAPDVAGLGQTLPSVAQPQGLSHFQQALPEGLMGQPTGTGQLPSVAQPQGMSQFQRTIPEVNQQGFQPQDFTLGRQNMPGQNLQNMAGNFGGFWNRG